MPDTLPPIPAETEKTPNDVIRCCEQGVRKILGFKESDPFWKTLRKRTLHAVGVVLKTASGSYLLGKK